jgi:hypothetical protein
MVLRVILNQWRQWRRSKKKRNRGHLRIYFDRNTGIWSKTEILSALEPGEIQPAMDAVRETYNRLTRQHREERIHGFCEQADARFSTVLRLQDAFVRWKAQSWKVIPHQTFQAQDEEGHIKVEIRGDFAWTGVWILRESPLLFVLQKLREVLAQAEGACAAGWEASLSGGMDSASAEKEKEKEGPAPP